MIIVDPRAYAHFSEWERRGFTVVDPGIPKTVALPKSEKVVSVRPIKEADLLLLNENEGVDPALQVFHLDDDPQSVISAMPGVKRVEDFKGVDEEVLHSFPPPPALGTEKRSIEPGEKEGGDSEAPLSLDEPMFNIPEV